MDWCGPRGLLARVLPTYEERAGQARFAQAVGRVLTEGGVLLAEAGTGTGKTLPYLLPAVELGRPVVGSTGTKNLQGPLPPQHIPLPARALGRYPTVAALQARPGHPCRLP